MKTKTLLLFLGISMSAFTAIAQKKEFKFGKISPEEFQLKAQGQDSAASAIKIFDVGNCYFEYTQNGFGYVFERHFRYKILNKNGYDLANYKVGLFKTSGGAKEDLTNMEAATYNMVDGKMVTSKLNKDAKFTEEFNKNYTFKKFALPNVKEGSIIEFKLTIKSDFIFNLRGWSFQSDVPILYSEYNVTIPQYFIYKPNVNGIIPVVQTKREDVNVTFGSENGTAVHTQYALENVPALKDEAFITTLDDYRPSIDFELLGTRFPGAMYRDYTGTWPKIVKTLAEDENFGLFINRNAQAKSLLPSILKGEKDSVACIKLIFDYVKQNIKWNSSYAYYASATNPKSVFEKKVGSAADINLFLVSLLREAKIDAKPLLLSTRDNGQHPGTPILTKFNNVIAHVSVEGKDVLLDATKKDLPLGMVSFANLSHLAFLVDLKGIKGSWINIEPQGASEKVFFYNLSLDKDNKLKGTLTNYSKGYSALSTRDTYRQKNNEVEYLNEFKKNKQGLAVANYKMSNLENVDEMLTETMEVVIEDNVEEAGNLVYFTPLLFERTKENLFKHDKRNFPVDFAYPIKESFRITVTFPDDYEIDKLPSGGTYKLPDNNGSFTITFINQGKTLMVRSVIDIPKTVYSPEEYFDLKELFKTIVQKQGEQIVFKKKAD